MFHYRNTRPSGHQLVEQRCQSNIFLLRRCMTARRNIVRHSRPGHVAPHLPGSKDLFANCNSRFRSIWHIYRREHICKRKNSSKKDVRGLEKENCRTEDELASLGPVTFLNCMQWTISQFLKGNQASS